MPLALPSPMLEVPPTPTPAEDSPQMKPWSSLSATPASPMWHPLSEAVLPAPILQPKALRDAGGWSGGMDIDAAGVLYMSLFRKCLGSFAE